MKLSDLMLNKVNTQLVDIVTLVPAPNGVDDTTAIQNALNKKGHVKIHVAGTYIVNRLVIDDDTFLDISEGITIKKKDGTNTNLLTNKGYLNSYRNKNIYIKGGIWDCNLSGNPTPASGLDMVGILFKGIDGLKITDIEQIGNEGKYCYLIADATNIKCININLNNTSDGLHFQPPIKNLLIENITGHTGDDMIAFTMGDYNAYALGTTGDIENVLVRNVYSDSTTVEHIKLVGDGLNHDCRFRNMRFENIRGGASASSVCIMQRDQAVTNNYLNNTYLENIIFSDIQPTMSVTGAPVFSLSATSGDITIENTNWKQQNNNRFIQVVNGNNGVIDKLTLRNVKSLDVAAVALSSIVRCDTSMTVNQLNIIDCHFNLASSTSGNAIYVTNGSIPFICIDNSYICLGASNYVFSFDGTSVTRTILKISNSVISGKVLSVASIPIDYDLINSNLNVNTSLLYLNDGINAKVTSNNSKLNAPILYSNGTTAQRILAINAIDIAYTGLLSALTPSEGDKIRSTNVSEVASTGGKGLYYYNGSAWVKYAG